MIFAVGTDIMDVARMERGLARKNQGLKSRVFTLREIRYCEQKRYPARHFAARFAAKEAFLKAMSTGLSGDLRWQEIEVQRNSHGQPRIILSGKTRMFADRLGVRQIRVSLSHTATVASATVILEQSSASPVSTRRKKE